jgi:hypothetical protein
MLAASDYADIGSSDQIMAYDTKHRADRHRAGGAPFAAPLDGGVSCNGVACTPGNARNLTLYRGDY